MKVMGLDGRSHNWDLSGRVPKGNDPRKRSSYHLLARELLSGLYPLEQLLEEVFLPGSDGLTLDFYLHSVKTGVEVQGEQHMGFTPFFHKTRLDFLRQQENDRAKARWCELNDIRLVCLPYNEEHFWPKLLS